jgi:hypothetical protein
LFGLLTCSFGVYFCWTVSFVENDRTPSLLGAADWWWAVQKSRIQTNAFFRFVGWFSHQAANASRWAASF